MSSRWAALPGPLPRPAGRKRHLHPPGNHASYSWLTFSPPALHLQHLVTYWVLVGPTPAGGSARLHRRRYALWHGPRKASASARCTLQLGWSLRVLCVGGTGYRFLRQEGTSRCILHGQLLASSVILQPPAPFLFAKTGVSLRSKLNTHRPWWRTALSPFPEVFLLERGPPGSPRESRVPPLSCGRWSSFLSISSQ